MSKKTLGQAIGLLVTIIVVPSVIWFPYINCGSGTEHFLQYPLLFYNSKGTFVMLIMVGLGLGAAARNRGSRTIVSGLGIFAADIIFYLYIGEKGSTNDLVRSVGKILGDYRPGVAFWILLGCGILMTIAGILVISGTRPNENTPVIAS